MNTQLEQPGNYEFAAPPQPVGAKGKYREPNESGQIQPLKIDADLIKQSDINQTAKQLYFYDLKSGAYLLMDKGNRSKALNTKDQEIIDLTGTILIAFLLSLFSFFFFTF